MLSQLKRIRKTGNINNNMTTVSLYDPVLTYEPSFDKSEGDKQKTYVVSTGPPPGNKERTKSKYIRIFDRDSVEELLFTIINFESLAADLSMENNDRIEQFQQILGPAPRAVWNPNTVIPNNSFSYCLILLLVIDFPW